MRTSYKRIEKLCKIYDYRLTKLEHLGDRKNSYYVYLIKKGNLQYKSEYLKDIEKFIFDNK